MANMDLFGCHVCVCVCFSTATDWVDESGGLGDVGWGGVAEVNEAKLAQKPVRSKF